MAWSPTHSVPRWMTPSHAGAFSNSLVLGGKKSISISSGLVTLRRLHVVHVCPPTRSWRIMPDRVRFSVPTPKFVVLILSKKAVLVACWILLVTGVTAHAAKLKPQAVEGWDRYVGLTEIRIDREQRDPSHFLWIDLMSEEEKKAAEAQLRNGQVVIGKLRTEDEGNAIKTPGALIHHWIGIAFIP